MWLIDAAELKPKVQFHRIDGEIKAVVLWADVMKAPTLEYVPVEHGRWEYWYCHEDDCEHHRCTNCKEVAPFHYEYVEDWDEDIDGEWFSLGERVDGIQEFLTECCPHCGAKMGMEE